MKCLIQRVAQASVSVEERIVGQIERGILVFIGIDKHDHPNTIIRMASKVLAYRIFADQKGKMNRSISDIDGGVLAISQFTLSANTQKGLRPSFSSAAPPDIAQKMYENFVSVLKLQHRQVESGSFGADMKVSLVNDGPVTFLLEL